MLLKPFVLLAMSIIVFAGDPPLAPDAAKAIADYERAEATAKSEYDKKVAAAKEKVVAGLQAAVAKATKAGDLDQALAIKAEISKYAPEEDTEKPVATDTTVIARASAMATLKLLKDGKLTEAQWNSAGGTLLTVKGTEVCDTGIVLGKGDVFLVLPHPSDTWTAAANKLAEYPLVDYRGYPGKPFEGGQLAEMRAFVDGNQMQSLLVVNATGKLTLTANDSRLSDNDGQIRVKIIRSH